MKGVTISVPEFMTKLSESKQIVRQHWCDRQQLHHLDCSTIVNRHSSKNGTSLMIESRNLFSGFVLEQGWRTQLCSVVKDGLILKMLAEIGEAVPFEDLKT